MGAPGARWRENSHLSQAPTGRKNNCCLTQHDIFIRRETDLLPRKISKREKKRVIPETDVLESCRIRNRLDIKQGHENHMDQ